MTTALIIVSTLALIEGLIIWAIISTIIASDKADRELK